jgi:hypothetical protein
MPRCCVGIRCKHHVARWVEHWGSHLGRLFADLTPTLYFVVVSKPLLSITTIGSISVERVAKPLKKNKVANKHRNRLTIDKRTVLLRVGLNLRLKSESLRAAKATLGNDDPDDPLIYERNYL